MNGRRRIEHCQILFGLMIVLTGVEYCFSVRTANGQESSGRPGDVTVRASSAGTNAYVSGKWGVLRLNLTNPTSQSVEVLTATYFEDEPTLQYGRRVWMPAMSRGLSGRWKRSGRSIIPTSSEQWTRASSTARISS